ncbi:MAG: glycerophosphodiester phosphodiesterase [Robiginitalea sp.]
MRIFNLLIVLCLLMSSCTPSPSGPLIIGHRGAMGYETENTLASVQKALDLGVDMIEIDVFQIRSGEIVVFHDERVDRLANSGGRIEEYYFLDLKNLMLQGGHRIPTLREVLTLVDHRVPINIELKGKGTADNIHQTVTFYTDKRGWTADQFLISSFDWEELRRYREYNPTGRIAVLTEGDPLEALPVARELGAEAINPHYAQLDTANVSRIHEEGFKIYTWTVNDPSDFQRLKAMGVDGVFSDYPDKMQ